MQLQRDKVREMMIMRRRPVVPRFATKSPRRSTIAAIMDLLLVLKKVAIKLASLEA
jgi:hypothetical protein